MDFLEKDLEQIIFETDNNELKKRGLYIVGKKIRQLYIGKYGIADLVTYQRDGSSLSIRIYELKQNTINIDTFMQISKYATGISEYLLEREVSFDFNIELICVGKNIDESGLFCFLYNHSSTTIFTYKYNFNGVFFKRQQRTWALIDNGFKLDKHE